MGDLGRSRKWLNPKECFGPGGDGKRFVVRADEKLSAFLELESVIPQTVDSTTTYSSAGAKKNNCTKGRSAFPASPNLS
jgi:hypothetical protein